MSEIDDMKEEIESLKDEIKDLEYELENLRDENGDLEREIDHYEAELEKREAPIDLTRRHIITLRDAIEKFGGTNSERADLAEVLRCVEAME